MRISDDPPHPGTPTTATGTVQTVEKTLTILEVVADRGGASAKEVAEATGYPLPTAYRLLQALVHADYLVHLRDQKRFELGRKVHALGAMAAPTRTTAT